MNGVVGKKWEEEKDGGGALEDHRDRRMTEGEEQERSRGGRIRIIGEKQRGAGAGDGHKQMGREGEGSDVSRRDGRGRSRKVT